MSCFRCRWFLYSIMAATPPAAARTPATEALKPAGAAAGLSVLLGVDEAAPLPLVELAAPLVGVPLLIMEPEDIMLLLMEDIMLLMDESVIIMLLLIDEPDGMLLMLPEVVMLMLLPPLPPALMIMPPVTESGETLSDALAAASLYFDRSSSLPLMTATMPSWQCWASEQ